MPITPTSTLSKNYQALGIDEIANDIETVFTSVNELETTVNALPAAPTTTVVDISSAQILAMGTTPIELLPAPGVGMYYDWSVIFEYTHVSTAYTLVDDIVVGSNTSYGGTYMANSLITNGDNHVQFASNKSKGQEAGVNAGVQIGYFLPLNEAITLFTYNASNPTLGDGTLRAIITYTTRTFGA